MNRSALVIKMLNYLYANGRKNPVSRDELANKLETNPRNIIEFKKELEVAGYVIESVRGKEGGYILKEEGIFPSLALDEKEKEAIYKVLEYLKRQSNFDELSSFESAMEKLKTRITSSSKESETIYLEEHRMRLNEDEMKMLNVLQEAKRGCYEVVLSYRKGLNYAYEKRKIRPYEVIVNSDGYYVLAEDITPKKTHIIKVFKISEERMNDIHMQRQKFMRDETFKISQYVGEYSLMKDAHEVMIKISGRAALLIHEQEIENTIEKYWDKDSLYLHFIMEGKYRLKNFILSLGSMCEVLTPLSLKEEIKDELKKALEQY